MEAKYKCDLCTYVTVSSAILQDHIRAIHVAEKPFDCDQCHKSLLTKRRLNTHIKACHEERKKLKYHCDLCLTDGISIRICD